VEINERSISFHGDIGQRLTHTLEVKAQEKRPVFAHGTSDQPWLVVERAQLNGRTATIGVTIPSVPNRPGETLQGKVTVTSNGNQRFVVPVTLTISGAYAQPILMPEPLVPILAPQPVEIVSPVIVPSPMGAPPPYVTPQLVQPAPIQPGMPMPVFIQPEPATATGRRRKQRQAVSFWVHLLPALLLTLTLLGMIFKDMLWGKKEEGEQDIPVDPELVIQPRFHDTGVALGVKTLDEPTMRFGIVMPKVADPKGKTKDNPTGLMRLTYFPDGYTNNTVIRVDRGLPGETQYFFGNKDHGRWLEMKSPLGKAKDGRTREGYRSVMEFLPQKIKVTQIVEVVPNDQPDEIEVKGKKKLIRRLDQCLVTYLIENLDDKPHKVGLRFLLDTFIGTNDGVPFTIPGQTELVQDFRDFDPTNPANAKRAMDPRDPNTPAKIPDFIQALEHPSLEHHGIIARVTLNLGKDFELPQRVTLGAWPHLALQSAFGRDDPIAAAIAQLDTRWEVPVLSMKTPVERKAGEGFKPLDDSAVVIYWAETDLQPNAKARELGFMYGLGDLAGEGGKLALTVGTRLMVNQEFPVTALVNEPKAGDSVTLELPRGFELVDGDKKKSVEPLPANATSRYSPVTWTVRATAAGTQFIRVRLDGTDTEAKRLVTIRSRSTFN
jgi:hypothetical protein